MTDLPYTDADLRAEAASCLNALSVLPTVQDIQRSLPGTYIDSHRTDDGGATWDDLLDSDGMGTAIGKIHALIDGAADVSEWAVNLGADNLCPAAEALNPEAGVRIHFAFDPTVPEDVQRAWIDGIHNAIREGL